MPAVFVYGGGARERRTVELPSLNTAQAEPNTLAELHHEESWGDRGHTAMSLFAMLPDHVTPEILDGIEKSSRDEFRALLRKVTAFVTATDPKNIAWKAAWQAKARELFEAAGYPSAIFHEIPNEYCGPLCCPHRVWYNVTTAIGVVKIGWRKRVIGIDWTQTVLGRSAADLFPDEDVTKVGTMIHAWSYEKAEEYLHALLATVAAELAKFDKRSKFLGQATALALGDGR